MYLGGPSFFGWLCNQYLTRNNATEYHNHAFLECPYSKAVWLEVWRKNRNPDAPYKLNEVIAWLELHLKGEIPKPDYGKVASLTIEPGQPTDPTR